MRAATSLVLVLVLPSVAHAERPVHVATDVIGLVRQAPGLSIDIGVHDGLALRLEAGYDFGAEHRGSMTLRGGSFVAVGAPIYVHAAHRGAFLDPSGRYERTRHTPDCIGPEDEPCGRSAPSWSAALVAGWRQPLEHVVLTVAVGVARTRVPEADSYDRDELVAHARVGYVF